MARESGEPIHLHSVGAVNRSVEVQATQTPAQLGLADAAVAQQEQLELGVVNGSEFGVSEVSPHLVEDIFVLGTAQCGIEVVKQAAIQRESGQVIQERSDGSERFELLAPTQVERGECRQAGQPGDVRKLLAPTQVERGECRQAG